MLIGILTTIPLSVVLAGCIHDMGAVVNSDLPSLEIFYQATRSKGVATFLQVWTTAVYYCR